MIIERNFPSNITQLPTIILNGQVICGLQNIINTYENMFNITDLINKAKTFRDLNPNYKIHDKSTHKIKK